MATPRKRWFRVPDAVFDAPLSNDQLAAAVRLRAYLNTRWARQGLTAEEACEADLPIAVLMQITGKGRADVAEMLARSLADVGVTCERPRRDIARIKWPNLAKEQGFPTLEQARESPSPVTASSTRGNRDPKTGVRASPRPLRVLVPRAQPLADLLRDELLDQVERYRAPRSTRSWAEEIDRMIRLDGIDPDEIEQTIRWLVRDDFWATNVQSGAKLRKQYARLHHKRRIEQPRPSAWQPRLAAADLAELSPQERAEYERDLRKERAG